MEKTILKVDGMSCEHCVKAIIGTVGELPGVNGVTVDLEGKKVAVEYDPTQSSLDTIKAEIEDQGYEIIH